jgi:hypothetical protein
LSGKVGFAEIVWSGPKKTELVPLRMELHELPPRVGK